MTKLAVIDSLARSGTTLLSSIIHSQQDCSAYRGVFHEPRAIRLGAWSIGMAQFPLLDRNHPIEVVDGSPTSTVSSRAKIRFRNTVLAAAGRHLGYTPPWTLKLEWERLRNQTLSTIEAENQVGEVTLGEWDRLLAVRPTRLAELDELYTGLVEELGSSVLGFRWNQGLSYIRKWLRSPDHYWITILRNPLDRACSAKKTHSWSWADSLESTVQYCTNLSRVAADDRVHVLYYEDLIENPAEELLAVFDMLDQDISRDELVLDELYGQDGEQYRAESADLVDEHGTHKVGEQTTQLYTSSIHRFKEEMPETQIERYRRELAGVPFLDRYGF